MRATARAVRSLGSTWWQDLKEIVFPMVLWVALPSWIGMVELLRASQTIVTRLHEPLFVLSIAGLIYFSTSIPIARRGEAPERHWRENA